MNKLPLPTHNDMQALQALAVNRRLRSYPTLQSAVAAILAGYQQYIAVAGNAFHVQNVPISAQQANFLKGHFESPPADLHHIDELRDDTEHQPCPMCGSLHSGTLDHLFPQDSHPEFSIFSSNLVPACKCNSIRQHLLVGTAPGERILHPYFDACLAERLIAAQFTQLGAVPSVSLRILAPASHPDYGAIEFHVQNVVERTGIKGFLRKEWVKLCRKPSLVVRSLAHNIASLQHLENLLTEELGLLDDSHEGKNNWRSIFVAGLLDPLVSTWLFGRLTAPGRIQDGPLT